MEFLCLIDTFQGSRLTELKKIIPEKEKELTAAQKDAQNAANQYEQVKVQLQVGQDVNWYCQMPLWCWVRVRFSYKVFKATNCL